MRRHRWIETEHGERCVQHVWISDDGYYLSDEEVPERNGVGLPMHIRRPIHQPIPVVPLDAPIPFSETFETRTFVGRKIVAPYLLRAPYPFTCDGIEYRHWSEAPDEKERKRLWGR